MVTFTFSEEVRWRVTAAVQTAAVDHGGLFTAITGNSYDPVAAFSEEAERAHVSWLLGKEQRELARCALLRAPRVRPNGQALPRLHARPRRGPRQYRGLRARPGMARLRRAQEASDG